MSTDVDRDLAALRDVTDRFVDAVGSIEEHQWALGTPCSDWDLAALVDHLTGGNWFTTRILAGDGADDAMVATVNQFGGRSATREEAIQSARNQDAAFHRPDALEGTWNHVAGDLPGRQILRIRLHDLIVHSWDIEETLRPPATLPDDLVRWGVDELLHEGSLAAQHFDLVDAPALRASQNRATAYLQCFGRSPTRPGMEPTHQP